MKTTIEDLEKAAGALARSERGQQAMRDLLTFLENGALNLDAQNISNVVTLLTGAWGEFAGTSREVMRFHLGNAKRAAKPAGRPFVVVSGGQVVAGGRLS